MSTYNIRFYGQIRKVLCGYPCLSGATISYEVRQVKKTLFVNVKSKSALAWCCIFPSSRWDNFFIQKVLIFFLYLLINICCGTHKKCFIEVLLMSTHNICFCWEIRKIVTLYSLFRARENRKNSRSGPKLRILDRFQTPQNANKSVQQVCALNPIFPQPTNFHESMMSKNHKWSSLPKLTTSAHLLNAILW